MRARAALLLLIAAAGASGARFETGQAARAVFGQSSFSSRDAGLRATSLIVSGDKLYAADIANRVLTFDLSSVRDGRAQPVGSSSGVCAVCIAVPSASVNESVMPGVATVSVWGKSVAVVDVANHRVLLWRDSTVPRPDRGPDLVLGRSASASSGISAATLVNPVSVALDGTRLYVGDAALHRVLVWNMLPVTDDQPADAELGQPDFNSSTLAEAPGPETIATPTAIASDGKNLFVADAAARRILIFSPADQSLSSNAIVNSASLITEPFAPGTLITIRGSRIPMTPIAPPPEDGGPLPESMGGVQVVLDGRALPILSVSRDEVEAQLPYDIGGRGSASLYLRLTQTEGVTVSAPVVLRIAPASPGLFAVGGDEPRGALLLHHGTPVTAENPAEPNEVLTIWATGLGAVAETNGNVVAGRSFDGSAAPVMLPVAAQVDGQAASVISARLLPGAIGVYEVQLVVPPPVSRTSVMRLSILQNGTLSNIVTFPIRLVPMVN